MASLYFRIGVGIFLLFSLGILKAQDDDFVSFDDMVSLRSFDVKNLYAGSVYALCFGKDEKIFFSSGIDPRVHIWNFYAASEEKEKLTGHKRRVRCLLFLNNGQLLSAGEDGLIRQWDLVKKKEVRVIGAQYDRLEQAVSFQSTAASIVGSGETQGLSREQMKEKKSGELIEKGEINAFDKRAGNDREVFRPYIYALEAADDNRYLLSGDDRGDIILWDLKNASVKKRFYGHQKAVNALSFFVNSYRFASASDDGRVIIWEWQTKDPKRSKIFKPFDGAGATALVISPNGKYLAAGSTDKMIKLYEFRGKDTPVFSLEGHKGRITKLCFTKNSRYLVSSSDDNTIRIWDLEQMEAIKIYAPQRYPVTNIVLSPTENFILSSGLTDIASIRLWKLNAVIKEHEG